MKWPDQQAPSKADAVVTLTSLVENSRKNFGRGPIVVVCGYVVKMFVTRIFPDRHFVTVLNLILCRITISG